MNEIEKKTPPLKMLEDEFSKLEQVECKITHNFAEGVYARERFAKADTLIIGKRHRHETIPGRYDLRFTQGRCRDCAGDSP